MAKNINKELDITFEELLKLIPVTDKNLRVTKEKSIVFEELIKHGTRKSWKAFTPYYNKYFKTSLTKEQLKNEFLSYKRAKANKSLIIINES